MFPRATPSSVRSRVSWISRIKCSSNRSDSERGACKGRAAAERQVLFFSLSLTHTQTLSLLPPFPLSLSLSRTHKLCLVFLPSISLSLTHTHTHTPCLSRCIALTDSLCPGTWCVQRRGSGRQPKTRVVARLRACPFCKAMYLLCKETSFPLDCAGVPRS